MALNLTFPAPNVTQTRDLVSLMRYINEDLTGYMFGITILFIIFAIMFISTSYNRPKEEAFTFSMFITAIISYLFWAMTLVSAEVVTITTIMTALSIFLLYRSGR